MPRRPKNEVSGSPKTRLSQLLKQIDALKREAEILKRKEVGEVIARIREAVNFYGITAADLGLASKPSSAKKVIPSNTSSGGSARRMGGGIRYADGKGNTWSGFGPRPRWFKDALAKGVQPDALKVPIARAG